MCYLLLYANFFIFHLLTKLMPLKKLQLEVVGNNSGYNFSSLQSTLNDLLGIYWRSY